MRRTIAEWERDVVEIESAVVDPVTKQEVRAAWRIDIRVKRLTVDEKAVFDRLRFRAIQPEAERLLLVRRTPEELERQHNSAIDTGRLLELRRAAAALGAEDALEALRGLLDELVPTDVFVVPDDEIRRRRMVEMTDADRAVYEARRAEDQEAYARFLSEALRRYVRVLPGQLAWQPSDETGEALEAEPVEVTNGELLAKCFGGRSDVLRQITLAVRTVNEASEDEKKRWKSRFDSLPGLAGPLDSGPRRAEIAGPAGPLASAGSEDATAGRDGRQSGPTA